LNIIFTDIILFLPILKDNFNNIAQEEKEKKQKEDFG